MIRPIDCLDKYGLPSAKSKWLKVYSLPDELQVEHLPKKIFCNVDFIEPYKSAIKNLHERNCIDEIKTFDGCFNIRKMRGLNSWSLHSWAIAIDLNAYQNQLFTKGKWSKKFIGCWLDAGFDYGGYWIKRSDPMHFQLSKI